MTKLVEWLYETLGEEEADRMINPERYQEEEPAEPDTKSSDEPDEKEGEITTE